MKVSFRNPKAQADHAVRQITALGQSRHFNRDDGKVHSLGTARGYKDALSTFAKWLADNRQGDLASIDRVHGERYLIERATEVRQSQLDRDRQAIQAITGERLSRVRSELETVYKTRAYTVEQLAVIRQHQSPMHAISTELAERVGLRAHEMLTLRPAAEQPRSTHREWRQDLFAGRQGELWSVIGKGGLVRDVVIPQDLADRLHASRYEVPRSVTDRGVRYTQHFRVGGGQAWSASFTAASKRVLGWSEGGHGARHTYAQQRMDDLQEMGYGKNEAMAVVSQELGHFREDVVLAYLR